MAAVTVLLAGLRRAWWPDCGHAAPSSRNERGTLADVTTSILPRGITVLGEGRSSRPRREHYRRFGDV